MIPSNFSYKFFVWRLFDVRNNELVGKKMCSKINNSVSLDTQMLTLKPGRCIVYLVMKDEITRQFKISNGICYLEIKLKVLNSNSSHILSSDWTRSSNLLFIQSANMPKVQSNDGVTLAEVSCQAVICHFRYSNFKS